MSKWILATLALSLSVNCVYAKTEESSSGSGSQTSSIPEEEADLPPDRMQGYYDVYKAVDVKYLRTLFNAYLNDKNGKSGKEEEIKLLAKYDKDYFRSKFIVLSRGTAGFGGTLITLIFLDRADKVFVAWVYPLSGGKTPELRGFDPGKYNDEDIRRMKKRYRVFFEDRVHSL